MPEYVYRAITKGGLVVKNKVEDSSKQTLVKRLKNNGLMPIDIIQLSFSGRSKKTQKRNISNVENILKNVDTTNLRKTQEIRSLTKLEKINLALSATQKVTNRDLVIFTQNFYLLKKANFNNIHALSTIIQSTENLSLKGILEDILAGVEARRKYVYNNGILFKCISLYIY